MQDHSPFEIIDGDLTLGLVILADHATNLLPDDLQEVRIIDIAGLDVQADGGTHVASTAMIGRMEVVKLENKGRGFRRLRVRVI